MRRVFAWLHRWVALLAGSLLVLLGLTGSLMVWQAELDAALNPAWFEPRPPCATPDRPAARVLALLAVTAPDARAAIVVAPVRAQAAYQVWERRDTATGLRREHFVDAACGLYLGSRVRGAWQLDRAHAVPLLYELHSKLLAGDTGHLVAGVGALVLLGLALSGIWLAWPARSTRAAWRRVLTVKTGASAQRWWFDLHRAAGLWLALLIVLMSVTGAALVFDASARALVSSVLPVQALPRIRAAAGPAAALPAEQHGPDELVALAQARFPQAHWSRLTLASGKDGVAEVRLLQAAEPRIDTGSTRVRLDAAGRIVAAHDPLNAPAGSVLLDWVFPLHSGEALGLAARLLWTLFGLAPAVLLGSGLWLWWRRVRTRRAPREPRSPTAARPDAAAPLTH